MDTDVFVDVLEDDLERCHDDELGQTGLAKHGTHRDQDGGRAEVSIEEPGVETRDRCEIHFKFARLDQKGASLFDAELKDAVLQVEPAANEQSPLEHVGGNEEVEGDAAESVLLQEGHQEAEADKHHAVDVHEHFEVNRSSMTLNFQKLTTPPAAYLDTKA